MIVCNFQISRLSEAVAECPRLKVLRVEENCLEITALTPKILKDSNISTLALEGNLFEMKKFHNIEGYEEVSFGNIIYEDSTKFAYKIGFV